MDILTQDQTNDFIKKLQGFSSKKGVKHRNLHILEPRAFDFILQIVKSKKVLEIERISDSCEQICNELGIEYHFVYSDAAKSNRVVPKSWDGDIIVGDTALKRTRYVAMEALSLLQGGRTLMLYSGYNFLESWGRYLDIFKNTPFNKMIVTPGRFDESSDGVFNERISATYNGAWYLWKGGCKDAPTIEWVEDALFRKYFLQDELTGKVLKNGAFSQVYRHPVVVKVDRGAPSQTNEAKAKRRAELGLI